MISADTVRRLRAGRAAGVEALWADYAPRVRRLCRSLTGDEQHADELTADAFLHLHEAAQDCALAPDPETWLFGAVVDFARRIAPRGPTTEHGDESERVDAILATMPMADRLVLALYDVQGFSLDRVARLTGQTPEQTRARLTEARLHFARQWEATRRSREPNR